MRQREDSVEPLELLGNSRGIREVRKLIEKASRYDYPVLITGETGVGKTLVARLIHLASFRREGPFLHLGCSNIPSDLFESELFGHEKGAFTGAIERKKGKVELADGGTLFLDEITDMSLYNQAKLLLFLESGRFYRVGGTEELSADVRIIAATNRDLKKIIRSKKFREDLYFRLATIEIYIPPLRRRKEDICPLVEDILRRESEKIGKEIKITPGAIERLTAYDFPGNIRELENIIRRALIEVKGDEIKAENISFSAGPWGKRRVKISKEQVTKVIAKCGGKKSKAARLLGISRKTLYKVLKNCFSQ